MTDDRCFICDALREQADAVCPLGDDGNSCKEDNCLALQLWFRQLIRDASVTQTGRIAHPKRPLRLIRLS